jgi:hypothetical protein
MIVQAELHRRAQFRCDTRLFYADMQRNEAVSVLQSSLCRVGITGQAAELIKECLRLTRKDA